MVANKLSSYDMQQFCRLIEELSLRPDLAISQRAYYLTSMIETMSEHVPGVSEFVKRRMVSLGHPVDKVVESGII